MKMLADKHSVPMTDYAYSKIELFLKDKALGSENTAKAYQTDVNQFFEFLFETNYAFVTMQEIEEIEHEDILEYRIDLVEKGLGNSTINRKMACVRSLFEFLSRSNREINPNICKMKRLSENVQSYGGLSPEEGMKISECAKTLSESFSVLVEFAIATSIRQSALLAVTKSNFTKRQGEWVVEVVDKGNKRDEKPITEGLYQRIMDVAGETKIFEYTPKTVQRAMKKACELAGIDYEGRNIRFHSLKNVAINWTLENTGSIVDASIQGNHKNINTTMKHYARVKKNFSTMAGIAMFQDADLSIFDNLSKEDILDLIASSPKHVQAFLVSEAKKANE